VTRWDEASRQKCLKVYDMHELDGSLSMRSMARAAGVAISTVKNWLMEPSRYDPYLDEVALTRALAGDKGAFDNLTVWESEQFLVRLEKEKRSTMWEFDWDQRMEYLRKSLGHGSSDVLWHRMRRASA
jgi:hypothetical protein